MKSGKSKPGVLCSPESIDGRRPDFRGFFGRMMAGFMGLCTVSGMAAAGTVNADFTSASVIPVDVASYTATGNSVNLTLNFAPTTGKDLTIVRSTGLDFITGTFTNLSQGQQVNLVHNGATYKYVANYYGGTGNDLVLQWANRDVYGWGDRSSNALGADFNFSDTFPVLVRGAALAGKKPMKISAGHELSLILCTDGTIVSCGRNSDGELGSGNTAQTSVPVAVDVTGALLGKYVVDVSAGTNYSLALCSDGKVVAWGYNGRGQLGDGSLADSHSPVAVVASGALAGKTVIAVSAGTQHSLALCSDGTLVAWGYNNVGQLGDGGTSDSTVPVVVEKVGALEGKSVIAIQAGYTHSLALCSDGTIAAWGDNTRGQLGDGTTTSSVVPVRVSNTGVLSGKTVKMIGGRGDHCVAFCTDGTVATWGSAGNGQLGDGNYDFLDQSIPVLIDGSGILSGKTISDVSAGHAHNLVVCSDATLAGWGYNPYGVLGGAGPSFPSPVPVELAPIGALLGKTVMRLASGSTHNLVLAAAPLSSDRALSGLTVSHGTLDYGASWRRQDYTASVTAGTSSVTLTPTVSHPGASVKVNGVSVASGTASQSIPLTDGAGVISVEVTAEDGGVSTHTVTATAAQDVTATLVSDSAPVTFPSLDATGLQLAINLAHAPVLGTELAVVNVTGLNLITGRFANLAQGQEITLSYGGYNYRFYADYYGGTGNDLVLRPAPRGISTWGRNSEGQLGNKTGQASKIPMDVMDSEVLAGKTVNKVATGSNFTLVQCSDGTLVAWGANYSGQLGNGTNGRTAPPVRVDVSGVLAGRTVAAISAVNDCALALCSDGTIAQWGAGVLVDGTITASNVPVRMNDSGALAGRTPVAVSVGSGHGLILCSDGSIVAWGGNSSGQLGNNSTTDSNTPVLVDMSGVLSTRSVISVEAGEGMSFAVCSDGRVAAWGSYQRPLGFSADEDQLRPGLVDATGVLSGKTVTSVSTGANFTVALCSDGAMAAWGANNVGQLGNGSTTPSELPVLVDASSVLSGKKVTSVSSGVEFSIAACADGAVVAWGRNTYGQLGDDTTVTRQRPVLVSGFGTLAGRATGMVSAGDNFSVALSFLSPSTELVRLVASEGLVSPALSPGVTEYFLHLDEPSPNFSITATTKEAWPVRINGARGTSGIPFPLSLTNGLNKATIQVGEAGGAVSYYRLTILVGNSLNFSFSSATDVPLEIGAFDFSGVSVNFSLGFVPPLGTNLMVARNTSLGFSSGRFSNLARGQAVDLSYGGKTYHFVANYYGGSGNDLVLEWAHRGIAGWGYAGQGQTGVDSTVNLPAPVAMPDMGILTGKTVVSVAAAAQHSVALTADGTLAVWGSGDYTLGAGGVSRSVSPISVKTSGVLAGKSVTGIAAASAHSLAVCSDGSVVAWGSNGSGQLGNGSNATPVEPVQVSMPEGLAGKSVVSVAVGGAHSLALCSDGSVLAWGNNTSGQLGDGTTTRRHAPVLVSTAGVLAGKTVVEVSAGLEYSLALCSDGTLVAWGDNSSQQLAPAGSKSLIPVTIPKSGALANKTVVALSAASHSTPTVLCSDGTVVTWGRNYYGERGNSGFSGEIPAVVTNTSGALMGKSVDRVTSGGSSSLAVCSDGTVVTWGSNREGQLGSPTPVDNYSYTPVKVTDNGVLSGGKPLFGALAYHAVVVIAESSEGYRGWSFSQPALARKAASADPDGDGISNLLEYVLQGDPSLPSGAILPKLSANGSNFIFSFNRLASSAADTTQVFQYSTDLVNWSDVEISPVSAAVDLGTTDGGGKQPVTVTIPRGENGGMFGRLRVRMP